MPFNPIGGGAMTAEQMQAMFMQQMQMQQ